MKKPRPIHVHGQPGCRRRALYRPQLLQRPGCTIGRHVGVLDAYQTDLRVMVTGRLNRPGRGAGAEGAIGVVEGMELDPGISSRSPVLVNYDVLARSCDDHVTWPGQQPDGQLVGHSSGRDIQSGVLADTSGEYFLQFVDRGIFGIDVVAHLGIGHGPPHLRGRPRHRVRSQVDHGIRGYLGLTR
jgi:hypothetical protein